MTKMNTKAWGSQSSGKTPYNNHIDLPPHPFLTMAFIYKDELKYIVKKDKIFYTPFFSRGVYGRDTCIPSPLLL